MSSKNLAMHGFNYEWTLEGVAKGQLISKCPFGVIVWTKIPKTKNLANTSPWGF